MTVCSIPKIFQPENLPFSDYTICTYICMSMLLLTAKTFGHNDVSFSIEAGAAKMGELKELIRKRRNAEKLWSMVHSHQFQGKDGDPGIQTADILAYEMAKRVSDLATQTGRSMRKSLESIIGDNPEHRVVVLSKPLLNKALGVLRWD